MIRVRNESGSGGKCQDVGKGQVCGKGVKYVCARVCGDDIHPL